MIEEITDPEAEPAEQADRAYWEKKADEASLSIMDRIISSLGKDGINPKLTYNRYHVAVGGTGDCWYCAEKLKLPRAPLSCSNASVDSRAG